MKVIQKVLTIISISSVGVMAPFLAAYAKDLAKVDGQTITDKDLEVSLTALNEGQKEKLLKDPYSKHEVLIDVIHRKLVAREAEKLKLDQEQVFKDVMEMYREQLLSNMLLEKKIAPQLSSGEIKKYYKSHRDIFSTDQVHVQHIVVSDEGEAKSLLAKAKDPKTDFQQLAEKYSRDPSAKNNRGDIGYIGHGQGTAGFAEAAFSAKQGDIIGPIRTLYGYHIIRVLEKKMGKPFEFGEVELQVKEALKQTLIKNYVDQLKEKAKIEVDGSV